MLLRLSIVVLGIFVLSGCVTRAEQIASRYDIEMYARSLKRDPFAHLDPFEFQPTAAGMIQTDIEFFGLVIDDEGAPIENAEVTFSVFDHLVEPFEFPYFAFTVQEPVLSDSQGRFRLENGRGAGIYVVVKVPGYAPVSAPRKLYVYADGLNKTLPFPSKEAPAEFVFEIRPPEAELKRISTGALRFVDDAVPLEVSLRTPQPYGVAPGTGEAVVRCERSLKDAAIDARFDWWCELTIPGGGIQMFTIDMDQAPLDGYVETGRLEYKAEDEDWDDRADRNLVVKFADGTYGFITMSMRMDGDFYVAFDGIWNPSGSTWLD